MQRDGRRGRSPIRVPRPPTRPATVRRRHTVAPVWGLVLVVVCLLGVLLGRLVQLQLVQGTELGQVPPPVSTREVLTPALRGSILAADGSLLVDNSSTAVVTVEPEVLLESPDEGRALVEQVAAELGLPVDQVWGRTRLCGTADAPAVPSCFSGSPYAPIPLAYDVDPARAIALTERPEELPGVAVQSLPVRAYPSQEVNAAHLLGYLGRPTQAEVSGGKAVAESLLGRAGLEQAYDTQLRGTDGVTTVTVDPRGVVTGRLEQADPVSGSDLVTHIDPVVQAEVEDVLAATVGFARLRDRPADSAAAVVLDVRTGGVVAAASWPTYDPAVWSQGISQAEFDRLTDPEQGEPLLNRAVSETFPPASTFKVVSLPAALATGVDPDGRFSCPAAVSIGGRRFTNFESRAHGSLDLREVMEVSCDTVFYRWAYQEWLDLGGLDQESDTADEFVTTAQSYGLGQRTGIDLPGEAPGLVPGREWKRSYWQATRDEACARAETGYPEERDRERRTFLEQLAKENCVDGWQYRPGDAVNLSIGQGDVAVTPVQMAVAYAAVANGGTLWEPHVAAELRGRSGEVVDVVEPVQTGTIDVSEESLEIVQDGLAGVNVDGTGAPAFRGWAPGYDVAGKTGSAESFGRRSTAWYASYGPVQDPRYAVVVVVGAGRHRRRGGRTRSAADLADPARPAVARGHRRRNLHVTPAH